MKTVLEKMQSEGQRLRNLLEELLPHSSIRRWHNPYASDVVYVGGHFAWNQFEPEGAHIQAKSLEEYRRFFAVLKILLRGQPEETLAKLKQSDSTILEVIQQQGTLLPGRP